MDQPSINQDLATREPTESKLQQEVLKKTRTYLKRSSEKMSQFYDRWDRNDDIYRGYRVLDRDDKDAASKKEPTKIIVPVTFAQVQTAISFIFSTLIQREHLFELRGMGPEDDKKVFALETDLQYQVDKNKSHLFLYFWLLDAFKSGFGVSKVDWVTEKSKYRVAKQVPMGGIVNSLGAMFGKPVQMQTIETVEEAVSYEGNRLRNISPYSFLPDPGVTLNNFQQGEFVAHEEEVSKDSLLRQEGLLYFGTKMIKNKMPSDIFKERPRRAGASHEKNTEVDISTMSTGGTTYPVVLSEVQFSIVPAEWTKNTGIKFGDETYPVKFVAVTANDEKVIRFERLSYLHDQYTYNMFEYSPDHINFYNPGLTDTIYELQDLITFFLNSHVVNVRKVIQNRFIGDPTKFEMDDFKSGAAFIRTKGTQVNSLDRIVKQLETMDVTKTHVADMDVLSQLVQLVTGINENALGQYSGGRRSATESRNVNASAAARLKMHASLMWTQGLEPCGRMMLSNTRQGRTKEIYNQIVGAAALDAPFESTILTDPKTLAGGFDFVQYDATMPSDRSQQVGLLREVFSVLVQNPETIQMLNKNPLAILEHMAKLSGIKNLRDFDNLPQGQMQPLSAQLTPDDQARQIAQNGTGEPVDISGANILQSLMQQ